MGRVKLRIFVAENGSNGNCEGFGRKQPKIEVKGLSPSPPMAIIRELFTMIICDSRGSCSKLLNTKKCRGVGT